MSSSASAGALHHRSSAGKQQQQQSAGLEQQGQDIPLGGAVRGSLHLEAAGDEAATMLALRQASTHKGESLLPTGSYGACENPCTRGPLTTPEKLKGPPSSHFPPSHLAPRYPHTLTPGLLGPDCDTAAGLAGLRDLRHCPVQRPACAQARCAALHAVVRPVHVQDPGW